MKRSTIWTIIGIVAALAAAGAAVYLLLRAKKQQECCICDADDDILFDVEEYAADPEVAEVFEEVADGE